MALLIEQPSGLAREGTEAWALGRFDELLPRFLLFGNGLRREAVSEEETKDRLARQLPRCLKVAHGFGMQTGLSQHPDAIVRLLDGALEQFLRFGRVEKTPLHTGIQELNADPDVLQDTEHPQERGDRFDLGAIQLDAAQKAARWRIVKRFAVVKAERPRWF